MSAPVGSPDVTVLLPTINRPAFLRVALESIARQTAVARIRQVLVSENAAGRDSESIVAAFADRLPVRFVRQDPSIAPLDHFSWLTAQLPSTGYCAMLHDDDWWAPNHLGFGLSLLDQGCELSAFFGSFYFVSAESSPLWLEPISRPWFGAGYLPLNETWTLGLPEIILSSLGGTPCHYSGIVARSSAFTTAGAATRSFQNPFDNDRIFIVELARIGRLVHSPVPTLFVRLHADQDVRRQTDAGTHNEHVRRTTEYLINLAAANHIDLRALLRERIDACPAFHLGPLLNNLSQEEYAGPLGAAGLMPPALATVVGARKRQQRRMNRWVSELAPPILIRIARRIERTLGPIRE